MNLARKIRWTPDSKAIIYKGSGTGMWRQSLDQSKPESIKGFDDVQVYQLSWSFDGKMLAYTRGVNEQEILLLQHSR
jgi:Tol biopolymer transport system component